MFLQALNLLNKTQKMRTATYPFYFINWQSMHKTNCMQIIDQNSMWEVHVFSSMSLHVNVLNSLTPVASPATVDVSCHTSRCHMQLAPSSTANLFRSEIVTFVGWVIL